VAALLAPGTTRVAVIVEPAHQARISTLLMSAYESSSSFRAVPQTWQVGVITVAA
jgi:hypothetical protein